MPNCPGDVDRLDSRLRLRLITSMPTNHTSPTALSARVARLAIDVQQAADLLVTEPFDEYTASIYLSGPILLLTLALDTLETSLYQAECIDQSHRARDLEAARIIADAQHR
jgi:hypothetical protein